MRTVLQLALCGLPTDWHRFSRSMAAADIGGGGDGRHMVHGWHGWQQAFAGGWGFDGGRLSHGGGSFQ